MATFEHELLKFYAETGECTLRVAIDAFGEKRGVNRRAIVKKTDRLLRKGLLQRRVEDHRFVYGPSQPVGEVEARYVGQFVRSRLRGGLSPLLAFLSGGQEPRSGEEK